MQFAGWAEISELEKRPQPVQEGGRVLAFL
jgi:hypothetical protein